MTGLLCLTFIVIIQCGWTAKSLVLQLNSTVKVQPGLSTNLECHIALDGFFYLFWIKFPLHEAPVCIATAKTFANEVSMCKQFENQSRIKVTWNQETFNLSFSSVEQTDIATYICGTYNFGEFFFGNGTKLIFEEHADAVLPNTPVKDNKEKDGNMHMVKYLVPALAATNVASLSLFLWLCHLLKKSKSSVRGEDSGPDGKIDEVNYAALTFGNKQRRTVQKRTDVETTVIYGAVEHQVEL